MPQLNPMIPFDTPKGEGFAFWRTDYSQEHDTLYTVIITATREVWEFPTPLIRGIKNISMGRTEAPTAFRKGYSDQDALRASPTLLKVTDAAPPQVCWRASDNGSRVWLSHGVDPNVYAGWKRWDVIPPSRFAAAGHRHAMYEGRNPFE